MKNYIGISRDHSQSMRGIASAALKDYNESVSAIRDAAETNNIDTIVSVVECGVPSSPADVFTSAGVRRAVVNSQIASLVPLTNYHTPGGSTPLLDSVGELITILESAPDANDKDVSFLVMVVTDGEENSSRMWTAYRLAEKIRELQATDRWTFVFRVPRGYAKNLTKLGIHSGNILEWETTERGMTQSTVQTKAAVDSYYKARSLGATSMQTFYADLSNISAAAVSTQLVDISNQVTIYPIASTEQSIFIRDFVEKRGVTYKVGCAFYQLTKPEKVQDHKQIVIRDRKTGSVYSGAAARQLLGLPHFGEVKVNIANLGQYDVFIQSTSVNRKLMANSSLLYWPTAK